MSQFFLTDAAGSFRITVVQMCFACTHSAIYGSLRNLCPPFYLVVPKNCRSAVCSGLFGEHRVSWRLYTRLRSVLTLTIISPDVGAPSDGFHPNNRPTRVELCRHVRDDRHYTFRFLDISSKFHLILRRSLSLLPSTCRQSLQPGPTLVGRKTYCNFYFLFGSFLHGCLR